MSPLDGAAVAAVEDLARRAVARPDVHTDPGEAIDHVTVRVTRDDESMEFLDLEPYAAGPRQQRGAAVLHDGPSFVTYVSRLATPATTLWADPTGNSGAGTITAVFDDHQPDVPGWREHRAALHAQLDPDWRDWVAADGKLMPQRDFAQFLLDHAHTIAAPGPAKLMPAVQQFTAARNAKYESAVNLTNGQVQMVYVEDITTSTKGRQNVALPTTITLQLFPYLGFPADVQAWPVVAHLRWQIPNGGGELKIGVKLERPDRVRRDAWERLCADVATGCVYPHPVRVGADDGSATNEVMTRALVPMLQGVAPAALRQVETRRP